MNREKEKLVDWERYHLDFPSKYFDQSYFDVTVKFYLLDHPGIKTAVDIGGGRGNPLLRELGLKVWLLDPFVKCSGWMRGKIGWSTDKKFDFVIARGSINYLTPEEIIQILKLMKIGGVFFANSFAQCPPSDWVSRRFVNAKGEKGIEKFRYNAETKKVEHLLIFKNREDIRHTFYYYSMKQYKKMLPSIKIERYKKNSLLLSIGAKWERMNREIEYNTLESLYFDYTYFLIHGPESEKEKLKEGWLKELEKLNWTEEEFLSEFDKKFNLTF